MMESGLLFQSPWGSHGVAQCSHRSFRPAPMEAACLSLLLQRLLSQTWSHRSLAWACFLGGWLLVGTCSFRSCWLRPALATEVTCSALLQWRLLAQDWSYRGRLLRPTPTEIASLGLGLWRSLARACSSRGHWL